MNTLKSARQEIKLLLGGVDAQVYESIPERPAPPCVVIEPASQYMGQGQTFDNFNVGFNLVLLVGKGSNDMETDSLDQLICDCIDAVDTWFVDSVDQPSQFEINGSEFLGTRMEITADKTFTT